MFLYLLPFVSVIGGVLFLDEQLTLGILLSGLLIIIGVITAQFPSLRLLARSHSLKKHALETEDHAAGSLR